MTTHTANHKQEDNGKMSKLKLAFLYTLIGGLVASAIVAIASILIGEFTEASQKALGTVFVFVTHSLFILGLIWADTKNHIGRRIVPTTILGVSFANIVTSTLGTWEVIEGETAWRAFLFYTLLIGSAFIISGINRLIIAHRQTRILLQSTAGLIAGWSLALAPWVFDVVERFHPLYFRIISAIVILMTTTFLVAVIMRSIALAKSKSLRIKTDKSDSAPGGLLAYYITIGVIASFVWFVGMFVYIADAVNDTQHYNRYNTSETRD